jgi:hypothetical protein
LNVLALDLDGGDGEHNRPPQQVPGQSGGRIDVMTIRDQEPLDDVADWANAVLALLADERA